MSKIVLFRDVNFQGPSIELTDSCDFLGKLNFNDHVSSIKVFGDSEWMVYDDANYSGASYRLSPGSYPSWHYWQGRNDTLSSVKLVTPKITLYEHGNYGGRSLVLSSSCSNFIPLGFNDVVSSIKVEGGRWAVYEHVNFVGRRNVLGRGEYPTWAWWGGANDNMSSLELLGEEKGLVTIYEHVNFGGRAITLTENTPNFVSLGFNDIVSSVKVHSGNWVFYQHPGYEGRQGNQLGPGNYNNPGITGLANDSISSAKCVR